tara:strand:- start:1260 stop:1715 length:456 start_codon:yes stop_codon:yes gene_type:complete
MEWMDTLVNLKSDLTDARDKLRTDWQAIADGLDEKRLELVNQADAMDISSFLSQINTVLLEGQGTISYLQSWEEESDDDDSGLDESMDDFDDADYVSTILTWQESGLCEIAVDVELGEQGISVQVNEVEIRPDPESLKSALITAFKEELDL